MSSAANITNESNDKQFGPNHTALDLDPHCLPLPTSKSIISANICSRRFEYRYVFFACNFISLFESLKRLSQQSRLVLSAAEML